MKQIEKFRLLVVCSCFLFSTSFSFAETEPVVARAIFTTDIIDREPVDQVLVLNNKAKNISFFTDLRHFDGQTVTHKWIYNSQTTSVVKFEVKGPRWRVFSRVDINPVQTGKWSVVVQDSEGRSIKASVFRLVESDKEQVILSK